jgi:putative ABC transport system permease protein
MALPVSYNLRNLFQRPVSTLTTAVGIALTVAILIGALALASGFQRAMKQSGDARNAFVVRKGADGEISSGVGRDAANIIAALPDVASGPDGRPLVSPEVVVVTNRPRRGLPGNSNLTVRGVSPGALPLRGTVRIVEGRMFAPGAAEIIVGDKVAPRFAGCEVGGTLRFGQRDFTVVGHFQADGASFESEIWGDNAVLMPVFRGEVFQSVTFRMKDPGRFDAMRQQLTSDPRLGVDVYREDDWYARQSELLANLIRGLGIFITLVMGFGAIFGAMNTMFAAVGARTREIATLQVLGFSPLAIMTSFMLESVLIALLGGVLGCLLALPINGITTSTTNFSSFSESAFAFRVGPPELIAGLVFASVLGVVGGFLPSLHAARQPIARTLRGN